MNKCINMYEKDVVLTDTGHKKLGAQPRVKTNGARNLAHISA